VIGRAAPCTCRINGNVNVNVKSGHSVDGGVGPTVGVDLGRHIDVETIGDGFL